MKYVIPFLLLFVSGAAFAQKDSVKAVADIKEATVYYGYGAELTHAAKVSVSKNTKYIIIDNLSTQPDQNSLQVSLPESVSLLAQQFSIYTPAVILKPSNPAIKRTEDSIALKYKDIAAIRNDIEIDELVLASSEKFIASTIATSTSKTALTDEVLKLVDYYNIKIERNKKLIFLNKLKIADIEKLIADMRLRIDAMHQAAIPQADPEEAAMAKGRIIMQVVCREDLLAPIGISYYTKNAGWQPMYDLRVNSKTNDLKLVYKANVIQNTGVKWTNTKLTLSTGTPNFTTVAPVFSAWYLQYYVPQLYKSISASAQNNLPLNSIPSIQHKEYAATEDDKAGYNNVEPSTLTDFTTLKQGLLNTNFEIALPYDIESNGQAHSINIKEAMLKSFLKNYAIPKLDPEPYLLAEVADWQNLDLIPGNANIIMDDTYIGRSFIDPNSTEDTLSLSLGKDKRIAVKRSLVKGETASKVKDNVVKQTVGYEIVVKNNKVKDVRVQLKDQFPLSNVKEIEVELNKDGGADVNYDLGVLNWSFTLKPGESRTVRFAYSIRYPNGKKLQVYK